jgi:hypothetical protein
MHINLHPTERRDRCPLWGQALPDNHRKPLILLDIFSCLFFGQSKQGLDL